MIGSSLSSEKPLKRSIPKILSKVASFSWKDSGDDGFNNYGRGGMLEAEKAGGIRSSKKSPVDTTWYERYEFRS